MYRILVLGGYGNFGARIARSLAIHPNVQLIIAGRNLPKAKKLVASLHNDNSHTSTILDQDASSFADDLDSLNIDCLIDPFDWPLEPDLPKDLRAQDEIRGRKDQEPITPNDFNKILTYIDVIDHEVTLALIVLYETAMRRSEVIKLRKEWIRFEAPAHIRIPGSEHKNRKPKVVMLTPVAVHTIEEVFDRLTEDGRVFQFSATTDKGKGAYIWKLFKEACREVLNRPDLIVHNIRLENATQLADRGMEDELRQRQTGHVDRKVLNDRYTRNRPEHRATFYQESFLKEPDQTSH